ncbi:protein PF3D7_1417600 isoform X1 [Hydra vulgaris]|uniref:protein PF3D7_1417600 isoform X1 n=1 Tax=Hydra vulgaris TaxID=6087 RepID=UPI0032EA7C97
MNWVGGARSRLRTKNEKKIQQQYFEKKREQKKLGLNICYNKPRHVELNDYSLKPHINYNRAVLTSSPVKQKSNLLLTNAEDDEKQSTVQSILNDKLYKSFENSILKSNPSTNVNLQNYEELNTCLPPISVVDQLSRKINSQLLEGDQLLRQKSPSKRKSEYYYFIEGLKKTKKNGFDNNKESSNYETQFLTKFERNNKMHSNLYQQKKFSASPESMSSFNLNKKYSLLYQNIETPQVLVSASPECSSIQSNIILSPPKNLITYQTKMNCISNEFIDSISSLKYNKVEEKELNVSKITTGLPNKKTSIGSFKLNTSIESPNVNTTIESSNVNTSIKSPDLNISINSPNMNTSVESQYVNIFIESPYINTLVESPNLNVQGSRFLDDCSGIVSNKDILSSWASSIQSNQGVHDNSKCIINDKNHQQNNCICSSLPINSISCDSLINIPNGEYLTKDIISKCLTNNICEKVTQVLDALNKHDLILHEQHLEIITAINMQKYRETSLFFREGNVK